MSNRADAKTRKEEGFTLVEALIAMVVLVVGLAAVSSLMVVAGSSNTAANHTTAAAAVAAQQMELLKSTPWAALPNGGDIDADVGATGECGVTPVNATFNCNTRASGPNGDFYGVGTMHVRWEVGPVVPVVPGMGTRFVQVAAESMAPAMGRRSRVVLTTFRTQNP